jgi:hypothetical protein
MVKNKSFQIFRYHFETFKGSENARGHDICLVNKVGKKAVWPYPFNRTAPRFSWNHTYITLYTFRNVI